jgi:DNA-binding transcriptional LysR family regulator
MINLNQLRVFYEAAKHQSFTEAAHRLFVTQPAITAQIKSFENQCNLKLFKKKGRKVYLTDEGKTLYECVKRVFECEKEIEELMEEMRELKRGILRLGTTKAYARYFMPFLISRFREAYPHVKVYLDEGSSLDMVRSVVELRNEVAVIAKVEDDPEVAFIPFSQEELIIIVAPDHGLAQKKSVSVEDLIKEPIIMKEAGSGTRKQVNDLFSKRRLVPNVLMETSNTEFIKQLVQRGDGISFVVREAVAAELKEKKLATVLLKGEQMFLDVSIAYLKHQYLSPPARAFVEMLKKMISKEPEDQGIRKILDEYLTKWQQGGL